VRTPPARRQIKSAQRSPTFSARRRDGKTKKRQEPSCRLNLTSPACARPYLCATIPVSQAKPRWLARFGQPPCRC
jgi:hypothetical protein